MPAPWPLPTRLGDALPQGVTVPDASDLVYAPLPLTLTDASTLGPLVNGASLAPRTALHHDSAVDPVLEGTTPLTLACDGFEGSYLSLTLTLEQAAARTLTRHHLVGLAVTSRQSGPRFARLSAESGPNTDVLTDALAEGAGTQVWDLFHTGFDALSPGKVWVDLIFAPPPGSRIEIDHLVLWRTPRGGF